MCGLWETVPMTWRAENWLVAALASSPQVPSCCSEHDVVCEPASRNSCFVFLLCFTHRMRVFVFVFTIAGTNNHVVLKSPELVDVIVDSFDELAAFFKLC